MAPLLLGVMTLLNGLAWSSVVPPLFAPDELQHFAYAHDLSVSMIPWEETHPTLPRELLVLSYLAGFRWVEQKGDRRIPVRTRWQMAQYRRTLQSLAGHKDRVDDPDHIFLSHPSFNRYHLPLYYWLSSLIHRVCAHRWVLLRLDLNRLFSLLCGLITVLLAYSLSLALWPCKRGWALAVGALVATHPLHAFTMSVVGDQVLEITLMTAALLCLANMVLEGWSWPRVALLGLLIVAGLLTRIGFVVVALPVGLAAVWEWRRLGAPTKLISRCLVIVVMVCLATLWWYAPFIRGGAEGVVASYNRVAPAHLAKTLPVLEYLRHFAWRRWVYTAFDGYWGADLGPGSVAAADPKVPAPLRHFLGLLASLATVAVIVWLLRSLRDESGKHKPRARMVLLLGLTTPGYVVLLQAVDYFFVRYPGDYFWIRAQYLLPCIAGQMIWFLLGCSLLTGRRWWVPPALVALMAGVDLYALFGVVLARYYSPGTLVEQLHKASVLSLMSGGCLVALFWALTLSCGLLCLVVGWLAWQERDTVLRSRPCG